MKILFDTYVIVRLAEDGLASLSAKMRAVFMNPDTDRLFSTVSITEIALKRTIGKLNIEPHRLNSVIEKLAISVIPYTQEHAAKLFSLALLHRDPFDRMLIATALAEDIPLVSTDREFRKYRGLKLLS